MTYEYVCTACQHQWEAEQPISADPLTECPECQQSTAKRLISGGQGFILKGGGWYADGYGSKKSGSSETSSASNVASSPSTTEKSEKKADPAKPDKPKTETKAKTGGEAA
jgi:putative FmdB family regulatory protein